MTGTAPRAATRRVVVLTRPTDYDLLLDRLATRGQIEFFLAQRGRHLDDVDRHHAAQQAAVHDVLGAIPVDWRRATLDRADLDRFLFEPDDVVVAVGQDGLVANVAKYLDGEPVIGVDPEPGRNPGVLVTHHADAVARLLGEVGAGTATVEARTMVEVTVDDGPPLRALNEVFVGHRSHQSARYTVTAPEGTERQSSSGLIVSTGTGATGWAASIHRQSRSDLALPGPTDAALTWFVREAWPSPATGTDRVQGALGEGAALHVVSEMDGGIVFGDGIESDALALPWGRRATIGVAAIRLHLLR